MDIKKAEQILYEVIQNDLRHKHYEQTKKIKKFARQVLSTDSNDIELVLKNLRPNESDSQKERRVELYEPFTPMSIMPVLDNVNEIRRVDGIKKNIHGIKDEVKAEIESQLKQFHNGDSLHDYIFDKFMKFIALDPNAWLVFDRQDILIGSKIDGVRTLPLEVPCEDALYFKYDRAGNLQCLVFREYRVERPKKSSITLPMTGKSPKEQGEYVDYNFYGPGFIIHLVEYDAEITTAIDYIAFGYSYFEVGDKMFWRKDYTENLAPEVQAIRCEAYPSFLHEGIFELFYETAAPILRELIKIKSYLDTTTQKHVFLRRYVYSKPCRYQDPETGLECQHGYLGGVQNKDNVCPDCHGSGRIEHSSEQDEIHLAAPDTQEGAFELSNLSHYEDLPFEIVNYLEQRVNFLVGIVPYAIYNQQTVDASEILKALTATQSRIEENKQYNKLSKFAEAVSRGWEKVWRVSAAFYGAINDDFEANMTYPYDYKLKTVAELVQERSEAIASNAPAYIIESIDNDILAKQYRNSPTEAAEIKSFESWKPWKDKTPEEISMIRDSRAKTDFSRVLWEEFERIMREVRAENEDPLFSEMTREKQKQVLQAKVAEIVAEIEYEKDFSDTIAELNPLSRINEDE